MSDALYIWKLIFSREPSPFISIRVLVGRTSYPKDISRSTIIGNNGGKIPSLLIKRPFRFTRIDVADNEHGFWSGDRDYEEDSSIGSRVLLHSVQLTILKDTKNVLVVTANGSNAKTILFLNLKTQIESLEKNFDTGNKLESYRKIQPAKRQVAIRFQNRRARLKTKQLEMDYQTLKQNYDHLKTNHDNLYEEKKKLRTEIRLNRKFELEHAEVRSKRKIPWFRGFLEENTDFW
ncbi:hypothetical protein ZOSMA_162G00310 [Zostera marina]|uniref:Homeobox-leucine zipper protein n=1 Tax=Zostera marina TaxID=29655 RepID=A0A0K9PW86_ZOSMR|nr:hypothetical protein ZOSMA_162G00310 [Zostera marina]